MPLQFPPPMKRRWLVLSLSVVALVVTAVGLFWGLRRETVDPAASSAASVADSGVASKLERPGVAGQAKEKDSGRGEGNAGALPSCWKNVSDVDRALNLENFRLVLAQLGGNEDPLLTEYFSARLAELVGGDIAKAEQVLEWVKTSTETDARILLTGLKATAAVQNPALAERLFGLSESGGLSVGARAAALDALETQKRLSPAHQNRLSKIALEGPSDDLAWMATRTLGRVMNAEAASGGDATPYWEKLLEIAKGSSDPAVRQLALEMPTYSDVVIPKESITPLAEMMMDDADPSLREQAAFRLSLTESPSQALEAYKTAFKNEYDECVRWAIVRFAVRAGGESALPYLREMAGVDKRFAPDLAEFEKLYSQGYQDFARIWTNKSEENHPCAVAGGEPHGG
jgi:hypothetical protein